MTIDAAGRDLDTDQVFMVSESLLGGWVCAPKHMTADDVQLSLDANGPYPGTSLNRWMVNPDAHTCREEGCTEERHNNPGLCEDDRRQHWHVQC
jgi:hypothetical protein